MPLKACLVMWCALPLHAEPPQGLINNAINRTCTSHMMHQEVLLSLLLHGLLQRAVAGQSVIAVVWCGLLRGFVGMGPTS
jgi:hypothetical protein